MRNKICIALCIQYCFKNKIFHHLGCLYGKITKYTSWELEHYYENSSLLEARFSKHTECDHAGFELSLGILGYVVRFTLYDNRHWDKETNTYES